jgi:transcriptional regulator with XRE-family HTH domain
MPGQERRSDRARRLARRGLISVGEDLREARLRAGMTLRELSAVVGASIAELSRIERGLAPHVPYETLAVIGAGVGLDVSIRAFPNGQPIRDAAQLELLSRLRAVLPRGIQLRTEVPLGIPGDLRAWDAVIDARVWWRPVEAESRLRDVQALQRRIRLKCRDAEVEDVILVAADTRHNRHVLRVAADVLAEMFPLSARDVLSALRAGRAPERSGILLL